MKWQVAQDHGGKTALHLVAERGIQKRMKLLFGQGARVPSGQTWPYAITFLRLTGIWEATKLLVDGGLRSRQWRTYSASTAERIFVRRLTEIEFCGPMKSNVKSFQQILLWRVIGCIVKYNHYTVQDSYFQDGIAKGFGAR